MKRNPIIKRYVKRLRAKLSKRRYRNKNKDKIKKYRNDNLEKQKKDYKNWYEKNRDKRLDYNVEWRKNNKEKVKITSKVWRENNHDRLKKAEWLRKGLVKDNIDKVYNKYKNTTNCDLCNIFLEGNGSTMKCMDHSHNTGLFRNILCNSCNVKRGEDNF
jgi:diketogulonate reductase-like aldo/keto reductase